MRDNPTGLSSLTVRFRCLYQNVHRSHSASPFPGQASMAASRASTAHAYTLIPLYLQPSRRYLWICRRGDLGYGGEKTPSSNVAPPVAAINPDSCL